MAKKHYMALDDVQSLWNEKLKPAIPSMFEKDVFEGYLNPSDGNFYETKTPIVVEQGITGYNYSGLIAARSHARYADIDAHLEYFWDGTSYVEVGRSYSNAVASESGVGGSDGLMSATDKEKLDDLPSWSQQATKPSYAYSEIGYTVATTSDNGNTAGAITIDGTKPLTVLTLTGSVSSLALASGKEPGAGHSAHVILYSASAVTVDIAHDATVRVCPKGADIHQPIDAGGYIEVDFLNANSKIFVRCV